MGLSLPRRSLVPALMTSLAWLALLAAPQGALAAAIGFLPSRAGGVSHFSLTYRAGAGETNRLTIRGVRPPGNSARTNYRIQDLGARVAPGRGCRRGPGTGTAVCGAIPTPGFPRIFLGDGNDGAGVIGAAAPARERSRYGPFSFTINGGAGNDALAFGVWATGLLNGGPGDDRLRGGALPDRIVGGDDDDHIFVAGGGSDAVACGTGIDGVRADASDRVVGCERVILD